MQMKYYRLIDDINYFQRWYLGDIIEVEDNWQFTDGRYLDEYTTTDQLHVSIKQDGKPMDYTTTEAYNVPIVSGRIKAQLSQFDGLQFIPVRIEGKEVDFGYFIMIVTNRKSFVNEDLSEFGKFVENDPVRPDKAGYYSWFTKLILDREKVNGEDVFRIEKAETYLIISEKVKKAMEDIKATGIKFIEV